MQIGEKIKQLRVKINLTQEELANRCDLSKGFISQVERDLTSPSIATLMDILESLGTNLRDFFNDSENEQIVFQKDDVFVQENSDLGHSITWIVPSAQKNKMEPILLSIKKHGRSAVYNAHDGEVLGYALNGSVTLHLGETKHKIKKGDSFYYKANTSYYLENTASTEALILWVSTPPNF